MSNIKYIRANKYGKYGWHCVCGNREDTYGFPLLEANPDTPVEAGSLRFCANPACGLVIAEPSVAVVEGQIEVHSSTHIDLAWLAAQRQAVDDDECFLDDCLTRKYRTTAHLAAAEALTQAQSMPWPDDEDATEVVDLTMRLAGAMFTDEHEAYADELEIGDVVWHDQRSRRVTRRFVSGRHAYLWFDFEEVPERFKASARLIRFLGAAAVGSLQPGDEVRILHDVADVPLVHTLRTTHEHGKNLLFVFENGVVRWDRTPALQILLPIQLN